MIANITVRQRNDFTKVKWGPLMGQSILTLFVPDAASPFCCYHMMDSVQQFMVKTIWKCCCALQHWASSASLFLSHSPSCLISMPLRDVPIHKKPAVGWTKVLEGTKPLSKVSVHHGYKEKQWWKSHLSSVGFHRQVNNILQQSVIY